MCVPSSGLGICSFFCELLVFCEQKSEMSICLRKRGNHSFVKSNGSNLLTSLFCKEQRSKERRERFSLGHKKGNSSEKMSKTLWKIQFFPANCTVIERERDNHSRCSFLKSYESNSLVSLFCKDRWERRAICSWSLFFKGWQERIAHCCSVRRAILSERAKSEFPTLTIVHLLTSCWFYICWSACVHMYHCTVHLLTSCW